MADMHDPRSKWELYEVIETSNDLKEIERVKRILSNRNLAQLIALGLVIPPLWYITQKYTTSPKLPTMKISRFMLSKLDHIKNPNKANKYDVFTILNVTPDASIQEINRAYKKLSTVVHSDKALQQQKKDRAFTESTGARYMTNEEFKARLEAKRNPGQPVPQFPSPAVTVSPELQASYDEAFKDLQKAYEAAKEYKEKNG